MSMEELQAWLKTVVGELAEAFEGDLERARRMIPGLVADSDVKVQAVARGLDEAIVQEQKRRSRVARLAKLLGEKRVELNGSTPDGIAEGDLARVGHLDAELLRWETGGVSDESAENVVLGIEADLLYLRQQVARKRRGKVRGWFQRKLSELSTRYFYAGKAKS